MFGVIAGRFCPVHLGHQAIIGALRDACGGFAHTLIAVGSANYTPSRKNFLTFEERRDLLLKLFPEARVAAVNDYPDDAAWMEALDARIREAGGDPHEATFFAGCHEDAVYYTTFMRRVVIINRFDGTTPKISATEVRDALLSGRSLTGLLDPKIAAEVSWRYAAAAGSPRLP